MQIRIRKAEFVLKYLRVPHGDPGEELASTAVRHVDEIAHGTLCYPDRHGAEVIKQDADRPQRVKRSVN